MRIRTVYDAVCSGFSDDVAVRIVRRDNFALCTMWSGKMGDLRADKAASVVAWGLDVIGYEIRDNGAWAGLVLIV